MFDITTILAIYGAVLSTMAIGWNIYTHFDKGVRLKVSTNWYVRVYAGNTITMLGVKAINTGHRAMTIVASGFELSPPLLDDSTVVIYDGYLPKRLDEGQEHISYLEPADLPTERIKYAWMRDAEEKEWRSKKWPLRTKKAKKKPK